jgi:hypothetical protein
MEESVAAPESRVLRVSSRILLVLLIFYGGFCFLIFSLQDRLLFPATRTLYRDPGIYDWPFEEVVVHLDEGEFTHGWYLPVKNARGVALFSHGNAGNIADRLESMSILRDLGLSVLAYDYGGYGKSSGKPSEQRLYADIRAMWGHLVEERGISPEEIILFGRSLGAGPTAQLATEVSPAGVILESTFTSVPDVAGEQFPFLPTRWLTRHKFDSLSKVGEIDAPLMIIHSRRDTLIGFHHGERLFEAASEPKTFLEISGDHNDGFVVSMDRYLPAWEKFLGAVLPPQASSTP